LPLLVGLLIALLGGCEREDPIRTYQAPRDPPMPQASGGPGIRWTLPAGWKPLHVQNEMTYAAFMVADGLRPLTVSQLPAAGGDVLPNVNRWQGQLGLEPSGEADLGKVASAMKVDGREAQFVDLTGPNPAKDGGTQQRMLAAIVPAGERVWFFKLQGPAEKLPQYKDAFLGFVRSCKLESDQQQQIAAAHGQASPQLPAAHPPIGKGPARPAAADNAAAGAATIPGVSSMKLPDGWRIDPNARPMRSATILVPGKDGGPPAEIVVSRLGAQFGGKQANLDRWRGQVGLPPGEDSKAEEMTLEQGPGLVYDFQGPEAAGNKRMRQFVFQTNFPNAPSTWFFRLIGPHDTVTAAKPAFDSFVRSLTFEQ
jgi:hypothetical protein